MDLLRFVLDRLHEELKYPMPGRDDSSNGSPSKIRRSERLASRISDCSVHPLRVPEAERVYRSIISDTFGGKLRSEIVCFRCQTVSVKEDPFFDLSIPIALNAAQRQAGFGSIINSIGESLGLRQIPLETCLQTFCDTELLDGKDRYWCEKCRDLVPCSKRLFLAEPPSVRPSGSQFCRCFASS